MPLHRNTRRRLCAWITGVFLAMQWLSLAQACVPPAAAAASAQGAEHGPACHGSKPAPGAALCKAHCSAEQQAAAKVVPGDAPAPAAAGFFVALPAVPLPPTVANPQATAVRGGAPPGWPPLYRAHGVLRI
jgi:hypothetical protein